VKIKQLDDLKLMVVGVLFAMAYRRTRGSFSFLYIGAENFSLGNKTA
jgi:hypothetical protein